MVSIFTETMSTNLRSYNILAVDDDADVLTAVRLLLKTEAKSVVTEKRAENIPDLILKNKFDAILLDMNFNSSVNTGNEGIYWLRKIKDLQPGANVIMITAYGDIDLAVRSLKEGAADFIIKPWNNKKLLETIEEVVKKKGHTNNEKTQPSETELIGRSEVMADVFYKINKVAATDANILILGENGTGKDLIAQAIHKKSLRAAAPFVKVDVGALSESLFESELFGHKKGAFTDARADREGRIEAANGGTLFLDEIGNINLQQQSKLLSVIQNRQVTRLGSNTPLAIDVRLVCATNMPLAEMSNELRFRKDLIYRINTVEIVVPPLRKRNEDILLLADHFLRVYSGKYFKKGIELSAAAKAKLKAYSFPGNVRELQYVIERSVIMAEQDILDESNIMFSPIEHNISEDGPAELKLSNIEKNTILRVIDKHHGNITQAAKELGITRTALYRRLNKYDI